MEQVKFTITYELDAGTVKRLNKLTERWIMTMDRKITPEQLFNTAMTIDGNEGINKYLDIVERFLWEVGAGRKVYWRISEDTGKLKDYPL